MSENLSAIAESRLCPVCEYDLQGNMSGRCPECGTRVATSVPSRIPWIFQRARGGVRAYAQTVALLLFQPRRLAAESRRRVPAAPAIRFHQESLALATIIGAGLTAIIYLLRGMRLEQWLSPTNEVILHTMATGYPALYLPVCVWMDRLLFLVPLIPSLFLSMQVSSWSYRRLLAVAPHRRGRSPHTRRRAERIAYYVSGVAPVLLTLLGLLMITVMLTGDEWSWALATWRPVLLVVAGILGMLALFVAYRPTFVLLSEAGYRHWIVNAWLSVGFVAGQVCVWVAITAAIFWASGFVLLAGWAMTH